MKKSLVHSFVVFWSDFTKLWCIKKLQRICFLQTFLQKIFWDQFKESSKTFMESLMACFIQFFCPFPKFEGKLETGLYLHSVLRFLLKWSFCQLVKQLEHSVSGDNNPTPFQMRWRETRLFCLNFLLLPISYRVCESWKNASALGEKS